MENPEKPGSERPVDRLARWAPLRAIADAWQPVVRKAIESVGPAVADALHGTPLGHPLHPLLTDVPIGAWTVTAVLDACELGGRADLAAGADAALTIGIGGAALAASSGWADWSDTDGEAKSTGMAHAVLNGTALALYVASLIARRNGNRESGIGLAMLGYAFVGAAGYLGGELAFGLQVGVRQTGEPREAPEDFITVAETSALGDKATLRADAKGIPILLYRDGDAITAISAVCTHRGAPLNEGKVEDGCVTCPWHGSVFRLNDGGVVHGPATFAASTFETRVSGGMIQIRAHQ